MNDILKKRTLYLMTCLILIGFVSNSVFGFQSTSIPSMDESGSWEINILITNNEIHAYEGTLRLFLVEPVSSIDNYNGDPFHFGVKDIILNQEIRVETEEEIKLYLTEEDAGLIEVDNSLLLAAIYENESHDQYAVPPDGNRFDAYDVIAVAAAYPNNEGENEKRDGFTHTVLVEEVATPGCRYCPIMGDTLNDIFQSEDYPFFFITLIYGPYQKINSRITNDLNVGPVPVAFFDGGYRVFLGGSFNQNDYRSLIEEAGEREVHNLDMRLTCHWNSNLVFPPMVRIDRPENGIYLFNELKWYFDEPVIIGPFSIEAMASDNESGIDRVEFYINNELRSTDEFSPYKFNNWEEDKFFGRYTIQVVAYDEFGYQSSDEIEVIKFF